MSDIAIEVENLSKQYKIGIKRHDTLRDAIVSALLKFYPNKITRNFIRGVAKTSWQYPEETIWALKDVSFEVKRGEVIGVIGRNGAGKTTLLKILSRITEPTSGRAIINGRVGSLLEVGTGFHPELSGRENIYLNGAILGMRRSEIDRKFDEIISFSEIEKFLDTPVKHYSSGMYVRLAFSVAAHLEPEILIVDEVLAVGDVIFQKKCLGRMENVAKEGRTVLFVSHNMMAIKSLCKTSILLDSGIVIDRGESDRVISNYLSKGEKFKDEITWNDLKNHQNSFIQLKRIRIVTKKPIITVADSVSIKILFHNLKPLDMYLNLILRTGTSEIIFESPSETFQFHQGIYEVTCTIPSNLLNNGIYSVQINFTEVGPRILLSIEDVIRFEVHELKREIGYFGKVSGYIRPKLNWKIRNLE